ncbi:protease pro-enzyme activation domain-containing protein [Kineococcus sp. GCM10028916]|uniref:S53 family peptidase n=1 Tax=Kineococcus sp. GCM10028916 TaxID=3273394 RepID=UPI00362BA611
MTDQTPRQSRQSQDPRRPLSGSSRAAASRARDAVPLTPDASIDVTLVLRRRAPLPAEVVNTARALSRDELRAGFGADPADVATVRSIVEGAGLRVDAVDEAGRRVSVSGPVTAVTALFDVDLREVVSQGLAGEDVRHRQREGSVSLPEGLDGIVTAVLGLDDRPQARAQFRVARAEAVTSSFTPLRLAEVYDFPTDSDGSGTEVAILELGGGFRPEDLDTYFRGLGLATPAIRAIGVDGGSNSPGAAAGADGEVMLDIEVVGAMAPGAGLAVYFAPNTDRGFLDALSTAVHADPTPAAVSISWGGPEDSWTEQARAAFDDALADAAALGVTVTAAAGDNGSGDGVDGAPHADFPASSPHALACGGTSLRVGADGAVEREIVWNGRGATGGGVSAAFGLPDWQRDAGVPDRVGGGAGRGVPDVAAVADPETGYEVLVDGQRQVIGGTSAVAPLWAALVARIVQARGSGLGLLQPLVYAGARAGNSPEGFRDITVGDNGDYSAGPGWDACTELGVPVGTTLARRLTSA